MPTLQELIAAVRSDQVERDAFESVCSSESLNRGELYNRLALVIARDFEKGAMSFELADSAINSIWAMIVDDLSRHPKFAFPELAYAIYEAFDAGEWNRGDGRDPVVVYTRPAIGRILEAATLAGATED